MYVQVEEIALKINNGEIEAVMSLGLSPELLEQAQLVAELVENGEIIPRDNKTEASVRAHGVKRPQNVSESTAQTISPDECQHKNKKLKIGLVINL